MENYSVIGKRLPLVDGPVKATGEAVFTADMLLPRMLFGKVLRSPYPHARIVNIDTHKAQKLTGVKAVITGKDTKGIPYGIFPKGVPGLPSLQDQRPLAMDKVCYIGDEVAAVAAIDEDVAEEAVDLIEVEYEELPAVFDPEDAMKPGAPQIHKHAEHNVGWKLEMNLGNMEEALEKSDHIFEDRFSTQWAQHCAIEPHEALASFNASSERLTLWASKADIYWTRRDLATTLQIPESNIRVI